MKKHYGAVLAFFVLSGSLYLWRSMSGASEPSGEETTAEVESSKRLEIIRRAAEAIARTEREKQTKVPVPRASDVDREMTFQRALSESRDIKQELEQGDYRWSETILQLESLFFMREERIACDRDLGVALEEPCSYTIHLAVERTAQGGTIRRAIGESLAPDDAMCSAYANCIAVARLGQNLPLPEGDESVLGINHRLGTAQLTDEMRDPAFVARTLETARATFEKHKLDIDPEDPKDIHDLKQIAMSIDYMSDHLDRLKTNGGR